MPVNLIDYIQLGVGGISIVIIYLIVREFLASIKSEREAFTLVIVNHLKHDTELHEKTIEAMGNLEETQKENTLVMRQVLDFLKNNKK